MMNHRHILLAAAFHLAGPGSLLAQDVLQLDNGDVVKGRVLQYEAGSGILIRHPVLQQDIEFRSANVTEIEFAKSTEPQPSASINAEVRMHSGDVWLGQLITMDAQNLSLDTAYAGKVTLSRPTIREIFFRQSGSGSFYFGPTSLSGWNHLANQQGWEYRDGALWATGQQMGTIGRDLRLGEKSQVEFDVTWEGSLYFIVTLYCKTTEQDPGNSYWLQFGNSSVNLRRVRKGGGTEKTIGSAQIKNTEQKGRMRVSILTDIAKRTMTILVDGKKVAGWTDDKTLADYSTGIRFQRQTQTPMSISNIRSAPWDGATMPEGSVKNPRDDVVSLVTGDRMSSRVNGIVAGNINAEFLNAPRQFPLDKTALITFPKQNPPPIVKGDAAVVLHDGIRLMMSIRKLTDTYLIGVSREAGQVTIQRQAVERITWLSPAPSGKSTQESDSSE
jgi:hypothetical protein